ncbi:MAG TPA: ATP-dependent RecD-like DNA helicase [Anaerohalosphaeraceae bacterium]|nr:ATP-dependent RecD-like DNA helicase [Anaerohalosphaeraceae bacterium]
MILSPEQQVAVDGAIAAVKNKQPLFRIGGYAGTGKTTIAKYVLQECPNAMVCAFTGKAAYRLREKGIPQAMTIHKTIYDFDKQTGKFFKKEYVDGQYFLIDEASMISRQLWEDVQSYGKPILLFGDMGQLEPVGDDPKLMRDPDIRLDKIHRQAADSGIIQFATDIRQDGFRHGTHYQDVHTVYGHPVDADLAAADIVLCGLNRTRDSLNKRIRNMRGFPQEGIMPGESLICLKNNYGLGVFNGQMMTVQSIEDEDRMPWRCKAMCKLDDGSEVYLPLIHTSLLRPDEQSEFYAVIDYGYAITCHKSQGSEWPHVLVVDEQCSLWEPRRWRYTAITRAAQKLSYFFPPAKKRTNYTVPSFAM